MRHFEKRGGLFRQLDVRGSMLKLTVGRAANDVVTVSMRQRSPAEAKRRLEAWARLALDAGFTELELPTSSTWRGASFARARCSHSPSRSGIGTSPPAQMHVRGGSSRG